MINPSILSGIASDSAQADDSAQSSLERQLNYRSACTLKALRPLLQVATFEQTQGMDSDKAAELSKKLAVTCRRYSTSVVEKLNLPESSHKWAQSFFAGAIAEEIARSWPKHRQKCLEIDWSSAICEIARPNLDDGLPPAWRAASQDVSIAATMMTAMQSVLGEYDTFNLFHFDRDAVMKHFSQFLLNVVTDTAQRVGDELELSDASKTALMQSLLKNGGMILASQWNAFGRKAVRLYKEQATPEQRAQLKVTGFPLNEIENKTRQQIALLGDTAAMTMNTVMDKQSAQQPAMGLGN